MRADFTNIFLLGEEGRLRYPNTGWADALGSQPVRQACTATITLMA